MSARCPFPGNTEAGWFLSGESPSKAEKQETFAARLIRRRKVCLSLKKVDERSRTGQSKDNRSASRSLAGSISKTFGGVHQPDDQQRFSLSEHTQLRPCRQALCRVITVDLSGQGKGSRTQNRK